MNADRVTVSGLAFGWVILIAAALVGVTRADDVEATKVLFARSEWLLQWSWGANVAVTFSKDGTMSSAGKGDHFPNFTGAWSVTGPRTVSANGWEWELSADGKLLYNTDAKKRLFRAFHRGTKPPPADSAMKGILTQPGMVWVKQGTDKRFTFALSTDGLAVRNEEGKRIESFWWQECGEQFSVAYGPAIVGYVLRGRDKSVFVKTLYNETFLLEPAKAGDLLPPKKLDRAKSPFYGTSWCRLDGKGALHMLTFSKRGTVSSSDFEEAKPEWDAFDDQNVRFRIGDKRFKLAFDAEQKRLIGGAGSLQEIWFAGRIPPKLGLVETKVLQDLLTEPRQVWVSWNEGKKIVYTFDNNSGVTIVEDDGKPMAARWKPLGAGSVGIEAGKDNWAFVLGKDADGGLIIERDGGTSLTLRKTDKESVAPGAPPPAAAAGGARPLSTPNGVQVRPENTLIPPPSNTMPEADFIALYAERSSHFPSKLQQLHTIYTNEVAKLDDGHARAYAAAFEEYTAGLDRMGDGYAKQANVAGTKAALAAKEKARKGEVDNAAQQPELAALAAAYVKQRETADSRREGTLLSLIGKYITALTAAISELLQRQDVKTAELFRLELDFIERGRYALQVGQMK